MDLLKKLTIKNLKLNKKRTIVTIIGIMLSVALITSVSTMYNSCIDSLIEFEIYEKGNFHVAFYNVPIEEINILENNRKIESIFLTQDIGYAKLEDSKNEYKPYAFVKAFTNDSLENLSVKLTEGRLPENENEIVIPTHLKTNGRITLNVGDTITLEVGTRISDGEELTQSNPYLEENNEELINTITKTYTIVGIIERPATNIESYMAPGYTFITYMNEDDISGTLDIYCRYTKEGLKEYSDVPANILGIEEEAFNKYNTGDFTEEEFDEIAEEISKARYNYDINSYLIDLEINPLNNSSVGGLGSVAVVVCLIIIFTSVFCIKNSFDISISEKIKQYGMLKSIGATKKQIKKNVFYEATILGLIGIPLGILAGLATSVILIIVSNYFLEDSFAEGLKLVFSFSWVAIVISIILGIITIYLSALKSSRKASRISPIESIKNSSEIKIKSKKIKSPKIIRKIFGIGGEISYKNLKRNKKKYRTTVISITVSVIVFIALSYFMSLAFDEMKNEISLNDYNLSILIDVNQDEGLYDKVLETTKLENIDNYVIRKSDSCYINNITYTNEYKEIYKMETEEDAETLDIYINVLSINNEQYKEYMKQLGLDYEYMKDKAILINNVIVNQYDEDKEKNVNKEIEIFECNENDILRCRANEEEFEIEISCITGTLPWGFGTVSTSYLIVSNEVFDKNFTCDNGLFICYDSSNANKLQDDIDELLNGYNYHLNNIEENARMIEKLYILIGIFLYGFIIVISLIGITNIFNTITTNMELRKPEFAMLKSVGMTNKEFIRMIRLESLFMGVKSLLFSIPIGIGLSYLIYNVLEEEALKFIIPINTIVISIVAVFLLITCIMKYSINKIDKQNTIETIRNENI